MANKKVTDLTELTQTANDDYVHVVDSSDTSQDPAGTSKKVKLTNLLPNGGSYQPLSSKLSQITSDATAFGLGLLDDADAAAVRTTLQLGTAATASSSSFDSAGAATSAVTNHEQASDPHPVYMRQSETDALYDVLGAATTAVSNHVGTSDPHSQYLTNARGDLRYDAVGAASSAITTHVAASNPHTQYLLSTTAASTYQVIDAELTAIAGLTSAADKAPYFTGSGTASLMTVTSAGRALIDDADTPTMRTTLGLVIGTDVQAQNARLQDISANLSATTGTIEKTGATTFGTYSVTAAGKTLIAAADAPSQRTALGLGTAAVAATSDFDAAGAASSAVSAHVAATDPHTQYLNNTRGDARYDAIGAATSAVSSHVAASNPHSQYLLTTTAASSYQALDAELTAIAGLTSASDTAPYFTGSGTAALMTVTSFVRTILDDADAATVRGTIGLGTAATQNTTAFEASGAVAAHVAQSDPHTQYLLKTDAATTYKTAPTGRVVTGSGAVTMVATDEIVEIAKTSPAATSVTLPASPVNWKVYTVKDGGFNCSTYPITLAGTIDGQTNPVMNQDGMARDFYFNGSFWRFK
jgi:hypothetical protein